MIPFTTLPEIVPDLDGTYDTAYAHQIVTTEDASVTYESRDVVIDGVRHLQIVRSVTKQAYYIKDQVGLWSEVVLSIPAAQGSALVRDMVDTLMATV